MIFFTFTLFAKDTQIFKIITPSPSHISDEGLVSVVVEVQGPLVDSFTISIDNDEVINTNVNSIRSHYCQSMKLHLGENSIHIRSYKEGNLVQEHKRTVFVASKVLKEFKYPPVEYSYAYFHNDNNEKICAKCHDMSVNEIDGVAFEDISKSNCYQCHSNVGTKKLHTNADSKQHAHAPSVNWLCTSCHNGQIGEYNMFDANKTKYSVPDPIEGLCFKCHKKTKELWDKKRFKHEPVASGRCNKCHNPHASDSINYLRKSEWELCIGCHKDKAEGSHIVKTFSKVMHPTKDKKDPSRKGRDLSCVSCHNPHVSNAPSLLQSESVMGLCSRCHKKK
jgi:predicted CXXCH cytochrome family protein